MKEIKDVTNRWKDISYYSIGRISIAKMTILPKEIYIFNATPIKLPRSFFIKLGQKILKFVWRNRRLQITKVILRKEKRSWRNQGPWLTTILQSYSYQNSMVLAQKQKYRSMEQDRKPRNKSIHLWSINQLQRRQDYTMEKRIFFNEWFSEN